LQKNGAKIYTTIDPNAQTDAENAVNQIMSKDTAFTGGGTTTVHGQTINKSEAAAMVSMDPTTGGIIAYYGGDGSTAYDLAATPHQPGSSFKPYVFTAGLQTHPDKIGLQSVYDGTDKQTIDGHLVHNSDGEGSPQMTVWDAMTQSVNTVFYKMGADDVGVKSVRQAALDAGIPDTINPAIGAPFVSLMNDTGQYKGSIDGGISIGQYPVRVIDQAQGYSTFADNGMYIPAHFVSKVTDINDNNVLYQFNTPAKQAFSSDPTTNSTIAATVTESLTQVAAKSGGGGFALSGGRPSAAKTGTQGYNDATGTATGYDSDAWTVGFTPKVVTAVWFGHSDHIAPIFGDYHNGVGAEKDYSVFGREEPAYIWQAYMNSYLNNSPIQQFGTSNLIQGGWNFVTNSQASAGATDGTNGGSGGSSSVTQTTDNGGGNGGSTTTDTTSSQPHHHTSTPPTGACGLLCTTGNTGNPGNGGNDTGAAGPGGG
jgi:membrane peptidoglycan carboxypeptidase